MRAFLSHSSKDKGFVEAVAALLRPGTFELDSQTFDAGSLNSQAIISALQRCDLFCLFLSKESVQSAYVDFEGLLGIEFLASGKLKRFIAVCLDEESFSQAASSARYFNIVRRGMSPESCARLIQGALVSASAAETLFSHPFIGREAELLELEKQLTDHSRPPSKALFISGNPGAGRRTLARKSYQAQFPRVSLMFPSIAVEPFSGLHELHRNFLTTLRPSLTSGELLTIVKNFDALNLEEKRIQVATLLNDLLEAHEAAFVVDAGGLLTDSGALEDEVDAVVSHLLSRPHPPVVFIAPRMIPKRLRRDADDLSYVAVRSLSRESMERLLAKLLKDQEIRVGAADLADLVALADGHPYNAYQLVEDVRDRGVQAFLASPGDFINWKHRQSSEYLNRVSLSPTQASILALLKVVPELDFASFVTALSLDPEQASDELLKLVERHLLDTASDRFMISPALRVAVERDRRTRLSDDVRRDAIKVVASSLAIRIEEGSAEIALVNSAVLAALESGDDLSGFASVFLLPSHFVWLAKSNYDQRNWSEAIRLSKEALNGASRLSLGGIVTACRYMCLASARVGDAETFGSGIRQLEDIARDDWAKSNVAFLRAFNLRLQGKLPSAEEYFRQSYNLSPGNISAAREIASIALIRGNLPEAERFAREAHSHAASNPYILDILVSVLIRKHGRASKDIGEINDIFDQLEKVGEEGGRSFFTTRKAEFEHLWGDNKEARRLIEKAISRTPNIFETRQLHAEILIKDGNNSKAIEVISTMREMVNSRDPNERRTNYRSYLGTWAKYLTEIGQYGEAKDIFSDVGMFTPEERDLAIREIEIVQAYKKT